MMSDREIQEMLEEALADGPELAPMTSRAVIRGRVREVRQRPQWLIRERGDEYPRRIRPRLRMLAIGVALVALLGMMLAIGIPGGRPPLQLAPATPRITSFPIDGHPMGVALADGDLWTGLFDTPAVIRLDPASGQTTSIPSVGRNCVSISAGAGSVWIPSCVRDPLARIDPATNEVTAMTRAGAGQTTSPAIDGDTAWLNLNVFLGSYAIYDAGSQQVSESRRLPQPGAIGAVAFDSAWALTSDARGAGSVLRLDVPDGSVIDTIPVELSPDIAVVTGDAVWVSTIDEVAGRSALVRFNPAGDVAAVIPFDQTVIYPASDGDSVWVLGMLDPATLYRVDESTNTATAVFTFDGPANALAVDGDTLWISRTQASEIVRVDVGR